MKSPRDTLWYWYNYKLYRGKIRDAFLLWLAFKIPESLLYWCLIRGLAEASAEKYSKKVVSDITGFEVLEYYRMKGRRTYLPNLFDIYEVTKDTKYEYEKS